MRPDIVAGPMNRNRSVLSIAASTAAVWACTAPADRVNAAERYRAGRFIGRVVEGRRKRWREGSATAGSITLGTDVQSGQRRTIVGVVDSSSFGGGGSCGCLFPRPLGGR